MRTQNCSDKQANEALLKLQPAVGDEVLASYNTKSEKMNSIIAKNLKGFLQFFCCTRGENDTGGGRRSLEDQNAYDVVMTAMNNNELT